MQRADMVTKQNDLHGLVESFVKQIVHDSEDKSRIDFNRRHNRDGCNVATLCTGIQKLCV